MHHLISFAGSRLTKSLQNHGCGIPGIRSNLEVLDASVIAGNYEIGESASRIDTDTHTYGLRTGNGMLSSRNRSNRRRRMID